MYPGLVNNTTTIWFQRWPTAALKEVAEFFLKDIVFEEDILKEKARLAELAAIKAEEERLKKKGGKSNRELEEEKKKKDDAKKKKEDEEKKKKEGAPKEGEEETEILIKKKKNIREKISEFFSVMHTNVLEQTNSMEKRLNRVNYVTPTNYIELVDGYRDMLK